MRLLQWFPPVRSPSLSHPQMSDEGTDDVPRSRSFKVLLWGETFDSNPESDEPRDDRRLLRRKDPVLHLRLGWF